MPLGIGIKEFVDKLLKKGERGEQNVDDASQTISEGSLSAEGADVTRAHVQEVFCRKYYRSDGRDQHARDLDLDEDQDQLILNDYKYKCRTYEVKREQPKAKRVCAMYKTRSGLRVSWKAQCKRSGLSAPDSTCSCSNCRAVRLVQESLRHSAGLARRALPLPLGNGTSITETNSQVTKNPREALAPRLHPTWHYTSRDEINKSIKQQHRDTQIKYEKALRVENAKIQEQDKVSICSKKLLKTIPRKKVENPPAHIPTPSSLKPRLHQSSVYQVNIEGHELKNSERKPPMVNLNPSYVLGSRGGDRGRSRTTLRSTRSSKLFAQPHHDFKRTQPNDLNQIANCHGDKDNIPCDSDSFSSNNKSMGQPSKIPVRQQVTKEGSMKNQLFMDFLSRGSTPLSASYKPSSPQHGAVGALPHTADHRHRMKGMELDGNLDKLLQVLEKMGDVQDHRRHKNLTIVGTLGKL